MGRGSQLVCGKGGGRREDVKQGGGGDDAEING